MTEPTDETGAEGTTTTPFDMMLVNSVSRYHVAMRAVEKAGVATERKDALLKQLRDKVDETREYIMENGEDAEGTYDTPEF